MPSFQPPRLRNYRFFGVSYMANIVPRNATGHGRGGEIAAQSVPLAAFFQPLRTPPLYFAVQNTEEEYTLYRNLNKNQLFTEKSELCLSTKDSSLKSISTPRIFG
jgi:hypothetical protein